MIPTRAMPSPLTFNLALFPGKSTPDMPRKFVQEDGQLAASHLGTSSVIGITEAVKQDAADFGSAFPHHTVAGATSENATWLGPDWHVMSSRTITLGPGLKGVNPHRSATVVIAVHRGSAAPVAFVFTHLTNGAWNGRPNKADAWRKANWKIQYAALQAEVKTLSALGMTVIVSGDMNTGKELHNNTLHFGPGQVQAYGSNLDGIWIVPGTGVTVKAGKTTKLHGHTDHAGAIVPVTLTMAGATTPAPAPTVPPAY